MAIGIHKLEDHEVYELLWLKWMKEHRPDLLEKDKEDIAIKRSDNLHYYARRWTPLGPIQITNKMNENLNNNETAAFGNTMLAGGWHSVEDRPLFTKDERGNWTCTEDGDGEFIAALPYNDRKRPNEELWWIRHCVVEDGIGLCVVGDNDNEPAGWNLEDVTHWMPMPSPPDCR